MIQQFGVALSFRQMAARRAEGSHFVDAEEERFLFCSIHVRDRSQKPTTTLGNTDFVNQRRLFASPGTTAVPDVEAIIISLCTPAQWAHPM